MLKRGLSGFHGASRCLHAFRSSFFYSTLASSSYEIANTVMVDYLVESVGFPEEKANSIVTKVSTRSKSNKNYELVVNYLKSSGFDQNQLKKVVTDYPLVLCSDVEKTLKPKIRAFQELGCFGSDLGLFISHHPRLLTRSLESHTVPTLELLKSLIGSNEELVSFLLKPNSQMFFSGLVLENLPVNVLMLQSYGLPTKKLKYLLLNRPLLLLQRPQWVQTVVKGVEEKLGIVRTSGMFLHGIIALSRKSEDKLESWLDVFRSRGWSETEILKLLGRHPTALHSSEESLRFKLKYLMEDLGFGSDYLASHPGLLSHSIEKRILPRTAIVQALKEKQLLNYNNNVSFYRLVKMAECKFMEEYVIPFKDHLPQLYQSYYTHKTHISLPLP